MGCKENRPKISFLVDGELPEEEAAVLRRHIESCQKCARYLETLRSVRKALEHAPVANVSPSFRKRLTSRLRRDGTGAYAVPIRANMWFRRAVAAAIAAVVLIALVLILSSVGIRDGEAPRPSEQEGAVAEGEKDKTPETPAPPKIVKPVPEEPETPAPETPERPAFVEGREPQRHLPPEREPVKEKPTPEVPEGWVEKGPEEPPVHEEPEQPDMPPGRGDHVRTDGTQPGGEPLKEQPEEKKLVDFKRFERKFRAAGKSGDSEEQVAMLHRLAQAPRPETYKLFKRILVQRKTVRPEVRREAVIVLAEAGTKEAVELMLYVYANDEDAQVKEAVPEALSTIKRKETLEWLAREVLVSAKDPALRRMVAWALAHVEEPIPHQLFAKALSKEPSELVRMAICKALGASGDTAAEDALIAALNDNHWLVRDAALRALSKVGTMRCTSQAIRLLNDGSVLVREAAAGALAANPDVRAVNPLVRLLMHPDTRLRGATLTALWRITGKRFTKEAEWRAWLKEVGPYPETNADPAAMPPGPSFLDIPLWSKSVVYVVDVSGSMRRDGKIKAAKELIKLSITELPKDTRFNVVFFSSSTRAFAQTKLPRADKLSKAKAFDWLDRVRLPEAGRTNFYYALTTVLRSRPDDVIVISDGVPSEGRYIYPPEMVREVADQNLQQKSRIHTVGFYTLLSHEGPTPVPVGASVDFLRDLAARNHGEFRYRWFNVSVGER